MLNLPDLLFVNSFILYFVFFLPLFTLGIDLRQELTRSFRSSSCII